MSTTLLNVVEWARPFVSNMLLLNDATIEPATTNANIILGTMLGPPFVWEWNRASTTFVCTLGNTDYTKILNDFGFIESGYLQVPSGAANDALTIFELQHKRKLEKSSQPGRPTFLSVFTDDQASNIVFRVGSSAPEQLYTVGVTYQKAMQNLNKISAVLPIPDKLCHIFKYGFLALAFLYTQDGRFREMNQKFIATLLGSQQGLDAMERNIFLNNWYAMLATEGAIGLGNQQGAQARGSM